MISYWHSEHSLFFWGLLGDLFTWGNTKKINAKGKEKCSFPNMSCRNVFHGKATVRQTLPCHTLGGKQLLSKAMEEWYATEKKSPYSEHFTQYTQEKNQFILQSSEPFCPRISGLCVFCSAFVPWINSPDFRYWQGERKPLKLSPCVPEQCWWHTESPQPYNAFHLTQHLREPSSAKLLNR